MRNSAVRFDFSILNMDIINYHSVVGMPLLMKHEG